MKIEISIEESTIREADELLAKIEAQLRGPAVVKGIRDAGKQIATRVKSIAPQAGYVRYTRPSGLPYKDKPGKKELGQTTATKILDRGQVKIGIIGYSWPAGAHGHLVDQGHELVVGGKKGGGGQTIGKVEPAPYLMRAVTELQVATQATIIASIRRAVSTNGG